jgi:hypothetical protein
MTGRIEKTVFISYRRKNLPWALFVYQNLTMHGYDVFFDYLSIDSGNFESVILDNIRTSAHFIVILTPSALKNCKKPGDWLRLEIETAIDENRNIIPIMLENFDFDSEAVKNALTGKLALLSTYNGLPVPSVYAVEAMERLRTRYLNKALDAIPKVILQKEAQKITEMQKVAASKAPPVNIQKEIANTPIEALGISSSVFKALIHSGITNVGEVLELLEKAESEVPSLRNFREPSLDRLRQKMREKGYLKND